MFLGDFLTADQMQKLHIWQLAQEQTYDRLKVGASGGEYTYCITPSSLGTIIKVTNNVTNEMIDLTDYQEW